MITVKTIKLKDIKDKEQLYIMIENNGIKEAINVGVKTFDRIEKLLTTKPQKDEKPVANKVEK